MTATHILELIDDGLYIHRQSVPKMSCNNDTNGKCPRVIPHVPDHLLDGNHPVESMVEGRFSLVFEQRWCQTLIGFRMHP